MDDRYAKAWGMLSGAIKFMQVQIRLGAPVEPELERLYRFYDEAEKLVRGEQGASTGGQLRQDERGDSIWNAR